MADADPARPAGLHDAAGTRCISQPASLCCGVSAVQRGGLQWHTQMLLGLAGPWMLWVHASKVSGLASALDSWA